MLILKVLQTFPEKSLFEDSLFTLSQLLDLTHFFFIIIRKKETQCGGRHEALSFHVSLFLFDYI